MIVEKPSPKKVRKNKKARVRTTPTPSVHRTLARVVVAPDNAQTFRILRLGVKPRIFNILDYFLLCVLSSSFLICQYLIIPSHQSSIV